METKKEISFENVKPLSKNEMMAVVGASKIADGVCCTNVSGVIICDGPRCDQYQCVCPLNYSCAMCGGHF